jgi:hypothetical protein
MASLDTYLVSSFALFCDVPCSSAGSSRWVAIVLFQPIDDDVPQGWEGDRDCWVRCATNVRKKDIAHYRKPPSGLSHATHASSHSSHENATNLQGLLKSPEPRLRTSSQSYRTELAVRTCLYHTRLSLSRRDIFNRDLYLLITPLPLK